MVLLPCFESIVVGVRIDDISDDTSELEDTVPSISVGPSKFAKGVGVE